MALEASAAPWLYAPNRKCPAMCSENVLHSVVKCPDVTASSSFFSKKN